MKMLGLHKSSALCGAASLLLLSATAAQANPSGGQVSAGSATISENGAKLDIHQQSDRVVIDWRGFDIAPGEHTQFHQPSDSATALNRVNSTDPSRIAGKLTANGNVILVNPNGVFFEGSSQVDVNSLIATTVDIDNQKFMAGDLRFDQAGAPNARIVNEGTITAKDAGLVGLVAPHVENHGIISAKLGTVELASADRFTIDLYGDGLMELTVSDKVTNQLVRNTGSISADGGTISITAASGRNLVDSLIQVEGELKAPAISQRGGTIIIGAATDVALNQSTVNVSGSVAANGGKSGSKGGDITITGDKVALTGNAWVDASGQDGGGIVHIGGEYKGSGDTPTAEQTFIGQNTTITVNANKQGNAGEAIVWADDRTQFYGNIYAQGGNVSGNGGFVETSGRATLISSGIVRADAPNGDNGQWLLDPHDVTIAGGADGADVNITETAGPPDIFATNADTATVTTGSIEAALNNGTSVTVRTSAGGTEDGNIVVNSPISKTGGGTATLTLEAHDNININTGAHITSTMGALNVILNADTDQAVTPGGRIAIDGANITTLGGNLTMGGGANPLTIATIGVDTNGISIQDAVINTGAGDISMRGHSTGTTNQIHGIFTSGVAGVDEIVTTSGSIHLVGTSDVTANGSYGIFLSGSTNPYSIVTGSGNITMNATGSPNATVVGHGLRLADNTGILSTTGNIEITAVQGGPFGREFEPDNVNNVIGGGTHSGNITLIVDDYDGNGDLQLQTTGTLTIEERTDGRTIGIGTGAGDLAIDNTELGLMTAGIFIFGGSAAGNGTSGSIEVNTTKDFADGNVTFRSGNNITLSGNLDKASGAGTANYIFEADGNVVNSGGAGVTASTGTINLTLNSDKDANNNGNIQLRNATITTGGGSVVMGGGANPSTDFAESPAGRGIVIDNTDITTGAGNISLRGRSLNGNGGGGIGIENDSDLLTTTGNISIYGENTGGGGANQFGHGIKIDGNTNSLSIVTGSGDITLNGVGDSTATGGSRSGIRALNTYTINSTSGNISLMGESTATGGTDISFTSPGSVGNGALTGSITLTGDTINIGDTIQTAGTLTIQERSAGTPIGIGTGAGTLDISNAELGRLTAGSYLFGSTDAGTLTYDSTHDFSSDTVTLSAANIALQSDLNVGTNTLTIDAATGSVNSNGNTLTADTLNLDAATTITANVNVATALDIANNSTGAILTGLFQGGTTQAEANLITGGPGNNGNYVFEGFIIRAGAPGGGGGGGGGASSPVIPIDDPVIPEEPITPDNPTIPGDEENPVIGNPVVDEPVNEAPITPITSIIETAEQIPDTVVVTSQEPVLSIGQASSMINSSAELPITNAELPDNNPDTAYQPQDSKRHRTFLSGLISVHPNLLTLFGYTEDEALF